MPLGAIARDRFAHRVNAATVVGLEETRALAECLGDVPVDVGARVAESQAIADSLDVDLDVIRGWWSLRSLLAIRWLVEHGFDPFLPGCEVDVLRSRM